MIVTTHQNDLSMAVSSGSALDAGRAMLSGSELNIDAMLAQENGTNAFDRSKGISAGEFINPGDIGAQ